jgi:hypothetical protein
MANDINKEDPHYKGEYGSIYEVNRKFPTGGVAGDFVVIDGWAHYWNADRGTWCVNAERDSYWDELITNIIEKFKLVRGATYMGVASLDTVPTKVIGAKMYYFATVAGKYKNFDNLVVPQGINVLYSENGSSWVNTTLLEVAQELGVSTNKVVSQKAVSDKLSDLAEKKFDKENIAQEFGDSEDKVVSQFALPFREIESPEFIKVIVDANDHLLFTINLDGEVDWGKGIPAPIKAKFQEIINQCQQDKTDLLESINTLKGILDKTTIKDEEGIVFDTPFRYIQNEEFIFAKVDANDRVLFGIQWDGTPVFGKTSAVEDRLQEQVTLLAEKVATIMGDEDTTNVIDTMNELKKFFANIENTQTLTSILEKLNEDIKNLQDKKVDKEEGKSLIEDEVKECFRIIENEEFLKAIVDAEDRVLFGFYRATGEPYYPLNEMYHVIQNEEYFAAWVTTDDKVVLGLRRDGQIIGEIHAVNALKQVISQLQADLTSLQEKVGTIATNLKELLDVFSLQENPEYMAVETDAEGKVLSATNPDGSKTFYTTLIPKSPINFNDRTIYEDEVEDYKELLLDSNNKILRYTDKNDVVHENREIIFSSAKLGSNESGNELNVPRIMNLPKYGYTDIKEETFYLTANKGYSDKDGIMAMLVNEDTQANAQKGLTPYKYFVKSTLQNTDGVYSVTSESVSLDFYVPSDIKEVGGKSYVTSSLTKGSDGSYTVNPTSIEVTKIVDKPNVGTWKISKKTKHWCVVDIDFGSYLKGTYNVLVSFQGSSTLYNRLRNFRYAFVKSDYKSKMKLKIGELLKVDKFNLKSYYSDDTKLKEPIIFRLYLQAKELRSFNEQYPWNSSSIISTGATGIIKSFPVCTSVGGEFYSIQFFGYKKDKGNYMLSGDEDGMIISGGVGCTWDTFNWSTWEDEMNDEPTESNKVAVEKFYQFINGDDFTKDTAPKHMNINDWIDYYIFIQFFRMRDNDIHNLILYSGKDKTVFSPFIYDLDLSFNVYKYNLEVNKKNTVWIKLASTYWNEICERYWELRKTVFTIGNFSMLVNELQSSIDYGDFENGVSKWGVRNKDMTIGKLSSIFSELITIFDLYFKKN